MTGAASRPKVRLLVAIWGKRYVDDFAAISLPTWLARGNVPALLEHCEVEAVVLTSAESVKHFHAAPAFRRLEALAPVKFIAIDDLIVAANYGVILTLAYARGVMDAGAAQTDTHFLFLNADFVLADGSLGSVAERIRAGQRCILAPSLRSCAEPLLPVLAEAVDATSQCLAMAPRTMVRLALAHLHPTTIGKIVTQSAIHCATFNQLYWQIDRETLLGRYHLLFMLCIRPERPLGPINSYCDYGFVPEMVPSGTFSVMDDSDAFFMLELQATRQERDLLHAGGPTPALVARSLAEWTTREHREHAKDDVVFHAGELPAAAGAMRKQAADFVERLHAVMPPAHDHRQHTYWRSGVRAWSEWRGGVQPPPAAWSIDFDPRALLDRPRRPSKRLPYRRRPWRHDWLDCVMLRDVLDRIGHAPDRSIGLAFTAGNRMARDLADDPRFALIGMTQLAGGTLPSGISPGSLQHVVCLPGRYDFPLIGVAVATLMRAVAPGGTVILFFDGASDHIVLDSHAGPLIAETLASCWESARVASVRYVGSRAKYRLGRLEQKFLGWLKPRGLPKLPLVLLAPMAVFGVACATAVYNRWFLRPSASLPTNCSSAMVALEPAGPLADRGGEPG